MAEAILVPISKDNISDYVNFEKEYDNNLKEFQTRIHPNNHQDFQRLIAEKLLVWYYIEVDNKFIGSIWLEKASQADFYRNRTLHVWYKRSFQGRRACGENICT